jgi:hypothetical protein
MALKSSSPTEVDRNSYLADPAVLAQAEEWRAAEQARHAAARRRIAAGEDTHPEVVAAQRAAARQRIIAEAVGHNGNSSLTWSKHVPSRYRYLASHFPAEVFEIATRSRKVQGAIIREALSRLEAGQPDHPDVATCIALVERRGTEMLQGRRGRLLATTDAPPCASTFTITRAPAMPRSRECRSARRRRCCRQSSSGDSSSGDPEPPIGRLPRGEH